MLNLDKDKLYFLPLGGSGEIGMNLNLYYHNKKWLMVDFGVSFDKDLGIELVMPDISFVKKILSDLTALVITHAHEDHIGAIPYLWNFVKCPIYATPFTAELIRRKLKEVGLLGEAEVIEVDIEKELNLSPFKVKYIPITHSIPESYVLKISTKFGNIVHTGDWKLDDSPLIEHETDVSGLKQLGNENILALVCDSTNVFEGGRSGSEKDVRENLLSLIALQKKRVIITAFASNVARLATFIKIAKSVGRDVILSGHSLWRIVETAQKIGYIDPTQKFLPEENFKELPPEKVLMICTGSQGEGRAALARIASNRHRNVKLSTGDTVIFSSKIIPGNELSIRDLQDTLMDQKINVITDSDDLTHVSGHPNQEELKDMYSWIKPQMLIPVHGEKRHLREHAAFALENGIQYSIPAKNGTVIEISKSEGLKEHSVVEHGKIVLDGAAITGLNSNFMLERKNLSINGCIFVTVDLGAGNIKPKVLVAIVGIPDPGQEGALINDVKLVIVEELNSYSDKQMNNLGITQDKLAKIVKIFIKGITAKAPIVKCHIIQ